MLLVRLWFPFHVITVIVAWQYRWRVAVAIAVLLATADFALSRPFNRPGGTLHPLFLFISVARLWSLALIAMGVGWWRHRQEEQEAFSRRLIESQEGERKRIAAELHDGLGQSLLVIKNRALVGGMSPHDAGTSKEQFDEIFRAGLRQVIERDTRITVVAEADDGQAALDALPGCGADVAILDVDMPIMDGFAVAQAIREQQLAVEVIILTMHKDERFLNAALDLGVKGYLVKDSAATDVIR